MTSLYIKDRLPSADKILIKSSRGKCIKIYFTETAWPIGTKLWWNGPRVALFHKFISQINANVHQRWPPHSWNGPLIFDLMTLISIKGCYLQLTIHYADISEHLAGLLSQVSDTNLPNPLIYCLKISILEYICILNGVFVK